MLLGAFQPPTPDNRILLRYALEWSGVLLCVLDPRERHWRPRWLKSSERHGSIKPAEVLRLRATSAVSPDPSVRCSAQDDGFVGGLEYNWLNMQKHEKIEKVTGSQDNDFVGVSKPSGRGHLPSFIHPTRKLVVIEIAAG